MAKILLIDDMQGVRESLEVILTTSGYQVDLAKNGRAGLAQLSSDSYDLLITDILMPEIDGVEVVLQSKDINPEIPVLAISAGGAGLSADQALSVAKTKADKVLEKPFAKDDLLAAIQELLS